MLNIGNVFQLNAVWSVMSNGLRAYFHSLGGNPSRRLLPSPAFVGHGSPGQRSQSGIPNLPFEHLEERCSPW